MLDVLLAGITAQWCGSMMLGAAGRWHASGPSNPLCRPTRLGRQHTTVSAAASAGHVRQRGVRGRQLLHIGASGGYAIHLGWHPAGRGSPRRLQDLRQAQREHGAAQRTLRTWPRSPRSATGTAKAGPNKIIHAVPPAPGSRSRSALARPNRQDTVGRQDTGPGENPPNLPSPASAQLTSTQRYESKGRRNAEPSLPNRSGVLPGGIHWLCSAVRCCRRAGVPVRHGGRRAPDFDAQAGQFAVDPAIPPSGIFPAQSADQVWMFRRVAGRPVLPRMDLAAQSRRTMSRSQRRIVSGVTSSRSPWRRALGITLSRVAMSARSAQFSLGGAAAAAAGWRAGGAGWRAGGAGSRSPRSSTPPHAGTAAATRRSA